MKELDFEEVKGLLRFHEMKIRRERLFNDYKYFISPAYVFTWMSFNSKSEVKDSTESLNLPYIFLAENGSSSYSFSLCFNKEHADGIYKKFENDQSFILIDMDSDFRVRRRDTSQSLAFDLHKTDGNEEFIITSKNLEILVEYLKSLSGLNREESIGISYSDTIMERVSSFRSWISKT